jgi:hypothetical protein
MEILTEPENHSNSGSDSNIWSIKTNQFLTALIEKGSSANVHHYSLNQIQDFQSTDNQEEYLSKE